MKLSIYFPSLSGAAELTAGTFVPEGTLFEPLAVPLELLVVFGYRADSSLSCVARNSSALSLLTR
jgi:hypothetical protein